MKLTWLKLLVILSPVFLTGCLGTYVALNVGGLVVSELAPIVVDVARDAIGSLTSDAPADASNTTDEAVASRSAQRSPGSTSLSVKSNGEICRLATVGLATEWDHRTMFVEHVIEAQRRDLALPRCQALLGFTDKQAADASRSSSGTKMDLAEQRINLENGGTIGLRSKANANSSRIAWIGGSVVVIGHVEGGGWVRVRSGGLTGYIPVAALKHSTAIARDQIFATKQISPKFEAERLATASSEEKSLKRIAFNENAIQQKTVDSRSAKKRRRRWTQAQKALIDLGIYHGRPDGVAGPKTRASVALWLKNNDLDEDTKLTDELFARIQQQAKTENYRRSEEEKTAQRNWLKTLSQKHRHAVAVIIGNRDYIGRTPDVLYAANDVKAVRKFLVKNLGYREGNIISLDNATLSQLNATFGTVGNHRGRLSDYVRAGKSDVVVFYSGHGVPGLIDHRSYLLPVNADPNRAELNGYPMQTLLGNLAKIPARSMTVYVDACFSGESQEGMLVQATSGINVQAKFPSLSKRMVVVTAAQNDQFASWDEDAKHGLFTKHLLEALRGKADAVGYGNSDGKVTLAELKVYLDEEMTYQARRRWSRDQNASVQGADDVVLSTLQWREGN
jgi:peptidoglycan hydrolase-like protein with peptidoglycan-binding domain